MDEPKIIELLTENNRLLASINERIAHMQPSSAAGSSRSGYSASNTIPPQRSPRADDAPDTDTPRGAWCDYVMPFGKHQGKKLSECPKSYLTFFVHSLNAGEMRDGDCKDAIRDYAACRPVTQASTESGHSSARPQTPKKPQPSNNASIDDDVPF